jgi:AGZA family xanthine/uracil permease-like MFS transporter
MAYIVVVNPAILSFAGIPVGPSTVATILAAVFGTLLMGLYANRPIAVAPYMGENAFVAFGLAAIGATWPQMLGAVFVSGLVFLAITVLGVRAWLAEAVSSSLKHAFAVGIGLFLALIGLYETGIVTSATAGMPPQALAGPGGLLRAPDVPLKIGDLRDPRVLLAVFGFLLIAILLQRKVRGALLVGIAVTAVVGAVAGYGEAPKAVVAVPFTGDLSLAPLFLRMDVAGVLRLAFLPALLTLVIMGLLDTLGTLVGVGAAGGMLDEKGRFPQIEKPMTVDALTCVFACVVGTTTSGAYIESAAGIREGARTGLAAVTTAILFAASLFFVPAVEPLQRLHYAYAPALVAVGLPSGTRRPTSSTCATSPRRSATWPRRPCARWSAHLGLRLVGIPLAVRSLGDSSLRTVLAAVALSGWPLGLAFRASAPLALPGQAVVNDAAFLVEQAGPILWIFTVLSLDALAGTGRRRAWGLGLAAALLALPSTLQFAIRKATLPPDPIPAATVRAMRDLAQRGCPGEVVLQRPGARYPPAPVIFAGLRVPYERFTPYLTQFASAADLETRHELVYRFFRTTDRTEALAIAGVSERATSPYYGADRVRFDTSGLLEPIHQEPGAEVYWLLTDDESVGRCGARAPR